MNLNPLPLLPEGEKENSPGRGPHGQVFVRGVAGWSVAQSGESPPTKAMRPVWALRMPGAPSFPQSYRGKGGRPRTPILLFAGCRVPRPPRASAACSTENSLHRITLPGRTMVFSRLKEEGAGAKEKRSKGEEKQRRYHPPTLKFRFLRGGHPCK
jgi:hypothetical protein